MLQGDDVVADRKPEPRTLARCLGGEKRLEQLFPHVGRDAGAVVGHPDLDELAEIARRDLDGRPEARFPDCGAPFVGGIESVAKVLSASYSTYAQLADC